MKQCPVCKTTYTDETLRFCLADGAALQTARDEEETIQMSADRNPLRIDFQKDTAPFNAAPVTLANLPVKKGVSPLIVAVLLFILLIFAGGIVAAVFFLVPFGRQNAAVNTANNSTVPANSLTAKSADSTDELNDKIANLQKQIEQQKNQKPVLNTPFSPSRTPNAPTSPTNSESSTTATVAPTGDGFLSLRTEPSVKTGVQLVKIPTGATVNYLGKCQNPGKTADGKTGRWCMVSYNNQTGWVFDAYLNF